MNFETERFSLDGAWRFAMDPKEQGERQGWPMSSDIFETSIRVPGSWQSQGIGYLSRTDERRTIRFYESFDELDSAFLTTKAEYNGTGWYYREFEMPADWDGRQIWLCFDGVHPSAKIWIDGKIVGEHRKGPLEPCRTLITDLVKPGTKHSLVVRVSEELRILQGVVKWPYFSGIHRSVYLETTSPVWFEDLYARGDIHTGKVHVEAIVDGTVDMSNLRLQAIVEDQQGQQFTAEQCMNGRESCLTIMVDGQHLWSPDTPYLYSCVAQIIGTEGILAKKQVTFGFRELKREGKRLFLNGKPLFLRGTGLAGPLGFPGPEPSGPEYYVRLVHRIKEYGFNYFRWHTYGLEPALLKAADEQGLLLQSELFSIFFEMEEERRLTEEQCRLMIRRNRNHPSVVTWCMGNEHDSPEPLFREFRDHLCDIAREMAPGVFIMDSDGVPDNTLREHEKSDVISAGLGISIGNVLDIGPIAEEKVTKFDRPYLIHEFGYPESFPNVEDIPLYSGGIRPFWLEHTKQSARKVGVEQLLPEFVENSRRLHLMTHKKAIEDVRRVDELAGYGNWGFHDFLYESTGLVDLFLRDKGITAEEFRKSNGACVLLCEPLLNRYTMTTGEPLPFRLYFSNHGNVSLSNARLKWHIRQGDRNLAHGKSIVSARAFGTTMLGDFAAETIVCDRSYRIELEAWIEGTEIHNKWHFWCFPEVDTIPIEMPAFVFKDPWPTMDRIVLRYPFMQSVTESSLWDLTTEGVLLTPCITNSVVNYLTHGGRVLLAPVYYLHSRPGLPTRPSSFGGTPSFSSTRGACGTIINDHPALSDFPHDGWCDLQWYDLVAGERVPHVCAPFHYKTPSVYTLDPWPVKIEPIIRSIPTWKNCENRAYLFEVGIGQGKLLATTLRILETIGTRPEGQYLFDSLLRYAASDNFQPAASVSVEEFDKLRTPVAFMNE